MTHPEPHPHAGKAVRLTRLSEDWREPSVVATVEDWADRIGMPWYLRMTPASLTYMARVVASDLPVDSEVVYVKASGLGYFVHDSEIAQEVTP